MGILFKAFGDAVCHLAGGVDIVTRAGSGTTGASAEEMENVKAVKIQTLTLLAPAFPNVKNVTGELERGFRFWSSVSIIPSLLHCFSFDTDSLVYIFFSFTLIRLWSLFVL